MKFSHHQLQKIDFFPSKYFISALSKINTESRVLRFKLSLQNLFKLEDLGLLTKWWTNYCLGIKFSHIFNSSAKPLAHQLMIFKWFSGNLRTLLYPSQKASWESSQICNQFILKNEFAYTISGCGSFRGNSKRKSLSMVCCCCCFLFCHYQ